MGRSPPKRLVEEEGRTVWRRFRDIDSDEGAFDYSPVVPDGARPFAVIAQALLAAGIGTRGAVGAAESYLFDASAVVRFGVEWIEQQPTGQTSG